MKKAIIITGPTASGKTSLALSLAKKVKGALISVDSIHVYKNCNIISGKDVPSNSKFYLEPAQPSSPRFQIGYWDIHRTPLYLTDVVNPTYNFNVNDFLILVEEVLKIIEKNGKTPIFVGGSTLYIKSLLSEIKTSSIAPVPALREKLSKASVADLQAVLAKYDKKKLASMNNSDINNPRRLIRAIEVAKSEKTPTFSAAKLKQYKFLVIGIESQRQVLRKKIVKRVEERMKEGAIQEAEELFKNFNNLNESLKKANGYKYLFDFLQKKTSKEEAIQKWKYSEFLHAKNQMTFFKKIPQIEWHDTEEEDYPKKIFKNIENFLNLY